VTMNLFPQTLFTGTGGFGLYIGLAILIFGLAITLSLFGTWPLAALEKRGRSISAAFSRGRRSLGETFTRLFPLLLVTQLAYVAMVEFQSALPPHTIWETVNIPSVLMIMTLALAGSMQAVALALVALILAKIYAKEIIEQGLNDDLRPVPDHEAPAA
jgi:hypothetical protein